MASYGLYARHVDGLNLIDVNLGYSYPDTRPAVVLDDVRNVSIDEDSSFMSEEGVSDIVLVTQNFKRRTNYEFVPNEPYISTTVTEASIADNHDVENVTVNAPEPGTPADSLYSYPTDPITDPEFVEAYLAKGREVPRTVWRPFFAPLKDKNAAAGEDLSFEVKYFNPADATGTVYPVELTAAMLPEGAVFENGIFSWNIPKEACGVYSAVFTFSDGLSTVDKTVTITVE
ncbi:MAG: hypothetical protein IAA97_00135 [Spirochaetes bacterium]|uniref:Uncharacterized protein n=1 Tax=Candidatus Ornithospirochaeta stercoripullorum TaxID=2840899 RepID=A0A9D9DXR4_9SPIO|nr:hypothetical protein [Candidatus Ornithospirochaeta stercoripullorum]